VKVARDQVKSLKQYRVVSNHRDDEAIIEFAIRVLIRCTTGGLIAVFRGEQSGIGTAMHGSPACLAFSIANHD